MCLCVCNFVLGKNLCKMVSACCAYACSERQKKGALVTFHSFPKDTKRRQLWERSLRRDSFKVTDRTRICSKHFTEDSFDRQKFGGTWLKPDAVPTLFEFPKYLQEMKIENKPLIRKADDGILEPSTSTSDTQQKRKYYLGDFDEDDMNSPTKAKQVLQIAQNQAKFHTVKIRKLNKKKKRLEKKVCSLKKVLETMKKNH